MNNAPADDLPAILRELLAIASCDGAPARDSETSARAAALAYEDARIDGLCHEGAWEAALETLRRTRATHH